MATTQDAPRGPDGWRKLAALLLVAAAVGLPINHLASYALLVVAAVLIFTGEMTARPLRWLIAVVAVITAVTLQSVLAPKRIDEGHNIVLPGEEFSALRAGLPADVYRIMMEELDAQYPPARRCGRNVLGCWRFGGAPDRTFAFSADGIFHASEYSRAVLGIDFADPIWLGLGFVNEHRYNWYDRGVASDPDRGVRDRRFWMGIKRWQITLPWFEAIRWPAAMAGGELCWRGTVLWEGTAETFTSLPERGCRAITQDDAGRRVFGLAIMPGTLAMHLAPPLNVRLKIIAQGAFIVFAALAVVVALVRLRPRRTIVPFALLAMSLLVTAINDASFIGGMRPLGGGNDGLFYDGVGRVILQKLLAGDIHGALQGGENVFYYGGPGLRYFRALEHLIFGETYLGFLSLVLVMPFVVLTLLRRFLPELWALALIVVFIAIPIGGLIGSSYFHYVRWAARGFADPAAYILFLCALAPLIGASVDGPRRTFAPAFFGALLMALAIFMKPFVAPAAAIMLGGAGLAALVQRQWARIAGLCIGFLPVFSMALHNWVYGGALVLFSANAAHPFVLVMPPSAYLGALREVVTLSFDEYALRGLRHLLSWLAGPSQSLIMAPFHVPFVAVLIYVVAWGRRFDPWLRLIGAAALAQHVVALFYIATPRYHYLTWFLTALVAIVWCREIGLGWLQARYPDLSARVAAHPLSRRLASGLARMQKVSS